MPSRGPALEDGFILRTVGNEQHITAYVELNETTTGEGAICDRLLRHRPETHRDNFVLVEDQRAAEFVSSTCLLPWQCEFEDITLSVAMLEMVCTRPDYRRRGLVRAQVARFHDQVAKREFDLSVIQGIPYFYRQYGYSYAIDHWARDSLPAYRILDWDERDVAKCKIREATVDDAALLTRLYKAAMAPVNIHTRRNPDYWRYLIQWARWPVHIIEAADGKRPLGYIVLRRPETSDSIDVVESRTPTHRVARAILRFLKTKTKGEIRLYWPQTGALVQAARSLGSLSEPRNQWLVRITDIAGFLAKIGPVFERRLAASDCSDLTAELSINLFKETFILRFDGGSLMNVASAGFVDSSSAADKGDLCIPPDAFIRLLLGYRTLDELCDAWPRYRHQVRPRPPLQSALPEDVILPLHALLSAA